MSHCVKLVDKNWHWEDRGMDVRVWGGLEGRAVDGGNESRCEQTIGSEINLSHDE